MSFSPPVRRLVLAVHLTVSVGWIGAVAAYLVLALAAANTRDAGTVRSAWVGMGLVGWYALVPLAVLALVTGVAMSLGTKWGLLLHYWVLMSFLGTIVCTAVLIEHMVGIGDMARRARTARADELLAMPADLFHPIVGGLLLIGILVLNTYKPRGLTRRGWRSQVQ